MPKNQFQRAIFALITLIVTVHAYVFFSLYVVNGDFFSSIPGATRVLDGVHKNGGVMIFDFRQECQLFYSLRRILENLDILPHENLVIF